MLVLSVTAPRAPYKPGVVDPPTSLTVALRTLRGSDSRLAPKRDEGARARTDASVSRERRRRRLDEEASVRMDALSVRRLLAVADEYVVGWLLLAVVLVVVGVR